ncbi:MAG: hypothetical protein EON88_14785, partial [Brevundimonas sp.]
MKTSRALFLVAAAAIALTGCSTVSRINPFKGLGGDRAARAEAEAATSDKSQRIPLLALDQQLKPADELKGKGFNLPGPLPLAECAVAGCNVENAVENVDAARTFQVAWRRDVGRPSSRSAQIMAPPVMAAGRVFTMDANATVSAFDAQTGNKVWSVNLAPKNRRDRVAYGGGVVFNNGRL